MISINNNLLNLGGLFSNVSSFSSIIRKLTPNVDLEHKKISIESAETKDSVVANKYLSQIRTLEIANENIQTTSGLLGTADYALYEINNVMGEIREIVSICASQDLSYEERLVNQQKIDDLFQYAHKIKDSVNYNEGYECIEVDTESLPADISLDAEQESSSETGVSALVLNDIMFLEEDDVSVWDEVSFVEEIDEDIVILEDVSNNKDNSDNVLIEKISSSYGKEQNNPIASSSNAKMMKLIDDAVSYKLPEAYAYNAITYDMELDSILPEESFDVMTQASARLSLKTVDSTILGITAARVNLDFKSSVIDDMLKSNLTQLSNLNTSQSSIKDADTAALYNEFIQSAATNNSLQLIDTQIKQDQADILTQFYYELAG